MQRFRIILAGAISAAAGPALACDTIGPSAPGTLLRPVAGALFSGYGKRQHPLLGIEMMHEGVDFEASIGDPVIAAAGGRVVGAGASGPHGIAVRIQHGGGMETLAAHLARTSVNVGDCVSAGIVIGQSGTTGLTERPKLHFEVHAGGAVVDPAPLLSPGGR
jgi:murein DD-endopeptidase MepM/ murein hydrolase activator NlpD